MDIVYTDSLTAEEFNALRAGVGWKEHVPDRAALALTRSDFLACARDGERAVGMARVIHDGTQAFVLDVIVHPAYQKRGIGKALMERVMAFLRVLARGGDMKVNLLTTDANAGFYEPFGFERRPNEHWGPGMTNCISQSDVSDK